MEAPGGRKRAQGLASYGVVLTLLTSIALSVIPFSTPALADPPRPPAAQNDTSRDDASRQREIKRAQAIAGEQRRQAELQRTLAARADRRPGQAENSKITPSGSSTPIPLQACNDATPQEVLTPTGSVLLIGKGWITKNRGLGEAFARGTTVELSIGGVAIPNAERFFVAPAPLDHPVLGRVWITRWEYPLTIATEVPIDVNVHWLLERRFADSVLNEDGTALRFPQDFSVALSCTLVPAVAVSGRITGASVGLSDGRVSAHHATTGTSRAGADTNETGDFRMLLRPGSYRFFFFTLSGPWIPEWWDDQATFSTATTVTLSFGAVAPRLLADLARGVLLSGRVTDADTQQAVPGVAVGAHRVDVVCCETFGATTDPDGRYQMTVPENVQLKVGFHPGSTALPYLEQWWNGKASFDVADLVVIGATDVASVDAALVRGVFVRGRVTDAVTGQPIANAGVSSSAVDIPCCLNFFASTDAQGDYAMVVRKNVTIIVGFFALSSPIPYLPAYWNGRRSFVDADHLIVGALDVSDIDGALERGVFVRGHVSEADTGDGLPGVFVNAFVVDAPCCENFFAITDAAGDYALPVRTNVNLKVNFFPPFSSDFVQEYYDNESDFGSADIVAVGTTEIDGINAALERGMRLSGRVSDPSGAGIRDVNVNIEAENCCSFITGTATASDGGYSVTVRPGRYKVAFYPQQTSGFLFEYYDNKPDFGVATVVVVDASPVTVNATLERGVLISGRVTDAASGTGLEGIFVSVQTAVCCEGVTGTHTGASGTYSVAVRPGSYKVGFFPPATSDLISEFYDDAPDVFAAEVVVAEAAPVSGIDAVLDRGVRMSGRVSGPDGVGAPNVNVNLVDPVSGSWIAGAGTNFDGTYSLTVRPGTYKVDFSPQPSSGLLYEYYDDKTTFEDADLLTAVVGTPLVNIDATLERGVLLSGRVTNAEGVGIPGVFVGVQTAVCCQGVASAQTAADGGYSVTVRPGSYKVGFHPAQESAFLFEFYGNTRDFSAATVVVVGASPVTGIDAELERLTIVDARVVNAAPPSTDFVERDDAFNFTFSARMDTNTTGDTLKIQDQDGTAATLRCGVAPNHVLCDWNPAGTTVTITVESGLTGFDDFGTTPGLQTPFLITVLTGFAGVDGNAVDMLASSDRLVDFE